MAETLAAPASGRPFRRGVLPDHPADLRPSTTSFSSRMRSCVAWGGRASGSPSSTGGLCRHDHAGKGASGGYVPIGVMATTSKVVDTLKQKDASFTTATATRTPMTQPAPMRFSAYIKKHDLIQQSADRESISARSSRPVRVPVRRDVRGLAQCVPSSSCKTSRQGPSAIDEVRGEDV